SLKFIMTMASISTGGSRNLPLLRLRRRLHDEGGDFLLFDQVVVGLDVGGYDGLPVGELLVNGFAEHVEDFIGLLGGRGIGAGDNAAEGDELIVQANGEIENV